jgi:hypothetical protein
VGGGYIVWGQGLGFYFFACFGCIFVVLDGNRRGFFGGWRDRGAAIGLVWGCLFAGIVVWGDDV